MGYEVRSDSSSNATKVPRRNSLRICITDARLRLFVQSQRCSALLTNEGPIKRRLSDLRIRWPFGKDVIFLELLYIRS